MKISNSDRVSFPVRNVFEAARDHTADLVPYLPDIRSVEVMERAEMGDNRIRILNHWHGATEIPSMAKKFVKPEMMSWKDLAIWHNDELYAEWQLETFYLNGLFSCKGTTRFIKVSEAETDVVLDGDLHVHPTVVPGVPAFLAKKAAPQIEGFIIKLISPNLSNFSKGVNAYLSNQ